jgi:hypothetical protein
VSIFDNNKELQWKNTIVMPAPCGLGTTKTPSHL